MTKAAAAHGLSYAFGVVKGVAYYHTYAKSPEGNAKRVDQLQKQLSKLSFTKKKKFW